MPLRVDILRHGRAAPAGPDGDVARSLTAAGRDAIKKLGTRLATEGWQPERVLASPYRRALETAELVLAAAAVTRDIERAEELEPERDPSDVTAVLGATNATHVLLVGHLPLVARLVQRWCGVAFDPAPGVLMQVELDSAAPAHGRLVRHLE